MLATAALFWVEAPYGAVADSQLSFATPGAGVPTRRRGSGPRVRRARGIRKRPILFAVCFGRGRRGLHLRPALRAPAAGGSSTGGAAGRSRVGGRALSESSDLLLRRNRPPG